MTAAAPPGLRAARLAARKTQAQAGALIGKNQSHYGKLELGRVSLSLRDALTLARAFGVTVESFEGVE